MDCERSLKYQKIKCNLSLTNGGLIGHNLGMGTLYILTILSLLIICFSGCVDPLSLSMAGLAVTGETQRAQRLEKLAKEGRYYDFSGLTNVLVAEGLAGTDTEMMILEKANQIAARTKKDYGDEKIPLFYFKGWPADIGYKLVDVKEVKGNSDLVKWVPSQPIPQAHFSVNRTNSQIEKAGKPALETSKVYAINNSNIFHRRNCSRIAHLLVGKELIEISSAEEAVKGGGLPCNTCRPLSIEPK